ncbi:MAG TPA: NAD-glutamate dehydrogenase domain-containing protein, partial [Solirubrobacteraceae bacterium]|nr:NAD-glutamate dehydrogenase domain-containing protein [Solirubrobacteraceae bacterium]
WESVKRHFRELGMDPAVDEFTVVGIGDMSGDVFGNGMLLSDKIKLLAAYDHRHVFIDPDPDPATSFAERKRLYERPGSSWDDYSVLSEGGGVYPRDAKWIELTDRARELLGIDEARVAPTDVIRAILRAQVDLLWNGGIGTVVKASTESDADAHDRMSDSIRVDARDLRCRVVGEGGNLGFTRRARVEFSAGGGLINADFIDNSAGVDCSDHEVNVKILLGLAERHGEMTRAERDELLEGVTQDVVEHVLYDSFLQAQIIAQEVERSAGRIFAYEDLANLLEETGLLDRASESLPGNDELTERRRGGRGMERPELAILLAYSKRWVARSLEASGFADDPWLERDLRSYFPPAVVERCGHLLAEHPLRTQLVCMINANLVVNALGPTFVSQLVAERSADVSEVVRAFRIAVEVTNADEPWEAIEQLDTVDRATQMQLLGGVDALVEAVARWYLTWAPGASFEETIAAGRDGFEGLTGVLPDLGTEERKRRRAETVERLEAEGVPSEVAVAHALRAELVHTPDIVTVAAATERSIEDVSRVFFAIGAELRLDWMERELARVRSATRMQRWALQAVRDDAFKARRDLAAWALREAPGADPLVCVERFLHDHAAQTARLEAFLRALAREGESDLAGLALAVRQLGALVA